MYLTIVQYMFSILNVAALAAVCCEIGYVVTVNIRQSQNWQKALNVTDPLDLMS